MRKSPLLRLRGAMAQLEHHRQDVALVLLHQLSRGVEPHHHQGEQHQFLELLDDAHGFFEGEGLAILANLQRFLTGVPFQIWDVGALVEDQHLPGFLQAGLALLAGFQPGQ